MHTRRRIRIHGRSILCTGDHPCQSPPAHHPCTTQWWALVALSLTVQSGGSPLETMTSEGCSTILGGKSSWRRRDPTKRDKTKTSFNISLSIAFCFTWVHMDEIKQFNCSKCTYYHFIYVSALCLISQVTPRSL